MKKNIKSILLSIICIIVAVPMLSSCEKNNNELEFLAVQLSEGENWSIIDKDGKVVAEEEYQTDATISTVYDGVYWVKTGEKYQLFCVDNPKKPLIDEEFDDVADFQQSDFTFVSVHNQPIRIINKKGKTVVTLPKSVKNCYSFSKEGVALFMDKNEKWGLMNEKGKTIVKPLYDVGIPINEGVFIAAKKKEDTKVLILNTAGKKVGEINGNKYDLVTIQIREGKIIVKDAKSNNPKFHALNEKGEKLFTIKKAQEITSNYKDGYLVIKNDNGKYGVVDDKGDVIIRPKYTKLSNYGKGLFMAQKNDKVGVINAKDETIIDFEYNDALTGMLGDKFIVQDGNEWLVIDKELKEYATFYSYMAPGDINVEYTEDMPPEPENTQSYDPGMEEDMEGYGTYGLMSLLPEGTSTYTGTMAGEYIIELTIVNQPSKGVLTATYRNVKYGTTMKMIGESLPSDDGDITFIGEENGRHWSFYLTGEPEDIRGTATNSENFETSIALRRKS